MNPDSILNFSSLFLKKVAQWKDPDTVIEDINVSPWNYVKRELKEIENTMNAAAQNVKPPAPNQNLLSAVKEINQIELSLEAGTTDPVQLSNKLVSLNTADIQANNPEVSTKLYNLATYLLSMGADVKQPTFQKNQFEADHKMVVAVQQKLMELNPYTNLGKTGIDGDFGKMTSDAVKLFQKNKGLAATGRLDEATIGAMFDAEELEELQFHTHKVQPQSFMGNTLK